MYSQCDSRDCGDQWKTSVAEDDPEADPSCREANIHRVTHISVESDHDQPLRRSDRSRRSMASPAEIPDTAQGDGKTEH